MIEDEVLRLTWNCDRITLECRNLTQDEYKSLCDNDESIRRQCNYTCDTCNADKGMNNFTVAGLIDAVLNTMPISYAAPMGVGNILRYTPMALINAKYISL